MDANEEGQHSRLFAVRNSPPKTSLQPTTNLRGEPQITLMSRLDFGQRLTPGLRLRRASPDISYPLGGKPSGAFEENELECVRKAIRGVRFGLMLSIG